MADPMAGLLYIAEVAQRYRVSRDLLERLIRDGKLQKHTRRFDRKVYISIEEFERVMGYPKPEDKHS